MQALPGCRQGRRARWRKKQTKRSASSREKDPEGRRAIGFPLLQWHDSGFATYYILRSIYIYMRSIYYLQKRLLQLFLIFLKACGWPGHVSAASASPRSLKLKKNTYGYVTFFRCFRGSMWYDVLVCDIRVDIASDIRGGEFSGVSLNQLVCPLFFFPLFCRDYRSRLYAVYYTVISPFVFKLVAYVVELRYGKFLVRPSNLIK